MGKKNTTLIDIRQTKEFKTQLFNAIIEEIRNRLKTKLWSIELLPKQKLFFDTVKQNKISLYIGGNKTGKTTIGAYIVVRYFIGDYIPDQQNNLSIWVVGLDKKNNIEETIKPKIFQFLNELNIPIDIDKHNDTITNLHNKNVIKFKSCDSGREKFQSADVDIIWFDEEPPEDIFKECEPRIIAKKGRMFFTMTPTNGMSWSYYRLYTNPECAVIQGSIFENKFIDVNYVRDYEKNLSDEEKQYRLYGKYITLGGVRQFDDTLLENYKKSIRPPLFIGSPYNGQIIEEKDGAFKIYRQPNPTSTYVLGVDTSEGINDPFACQILEYNQGHIFQAAEYNKKLEIELQSKIILEIAEIYQNPLLIIERNGSGIAILDKIKYVYQGTIYSQENLGEFEPTITTHLGWRTTGISKLKMIQDTRQLLRDNQITLYSEQLFQQFSNYIEKNGKIFAQHGCDDLLMATMLAIQGVLSIQIGIKFKNDPDAAYKKINIPYNKINRNKYRWLNY